MSQVIHRCEGCNATRSLNGARPRGTYVDCVNCGERSLHYPVHGAVRERIHNTKPQLHGVHQYAPAKRT